jgi:CRISPR-associated protein Csm5
MNVYDVTLPFALHVTILSPVHIGSGDIYSPKFQHYSQGEQALYVASQQSLLQAIGSNTQRAHEFVAFCEHENETLSHLIERWRLLPAQTMAYKVFCEVMPGDIRAFMRQYDGAGQAFLPGSSLKGAIRSALMRFAYSSSSDMQKQLVKDLANYDMLRSDRDRKAVRQRIEQRLFSNLPINIPDSKTSNHDLLRLLQFSDSAPLPYNYLFIAPVLVYSSQSDKRLKQRFLNPTYVEALRPNATFMMPGVMNQYLRSELAKSVLPQIRRQGRFTGDFIYACREVGKALAQQELAFYDYHVISGDPIAKPMSAWFSQLLSQMDTLRDSEAILPMGWGSGYDAKTVTDLIGNTLMERVTSIDFSTRKLGRPSRSNDMLPDPLVPKTRRIVNYKDTKYPMGWVKLTLR